MESKAQNYKFITLAAFACTNAECMALDHRTDMHGECPSCHAKYVTLEPLVEEKPNKRSKR